MITCMLGMSSCENNDGCSPYRVKRAVYTQCVCRCTAGPTYMSSFPCVCRVIGGRGGHESVAFIDTITSSDTVRMSSIAIACIDTNGVDACYATLGMHTI